MENKDAKVLSMNKMGFEFELTNSKGDSRVERYEFDADEKDPLADVAAVQKEVTSLQSKSRVAVLPLNPGVFITLVLWLLIMCGTSESQGIGTTYVQILQSIAHGIFQSATNSRIALCLMLGAHMCEALYAWFLLAQLQLDFFTKASWGALIIVFGFPVTSQVLFLHKYWQRKQQNAPESSASDTKKNK